MDKEIRNLLVNYYEKSGNSIFVPQSILPKVIDIVISKGTKKVVQFISIENAYALDLNNCMYKYTDKCDVTKVYVVRYIKQISDPACLKLIQSDKKQGIDAFVMPLSKVKSEMLPDFFEFILFDEKIALINKTMFASENELTEDFDIISDCKKWIAFGEKQRELQLKADFLQEPLMQSADMLYEVANLCCTSNHVNEHSCRWYHSIWQYLRLLDMVSTPSWHNDFYLCKLFEASSEKNNNVFISGTADYSMLAYVLHAAENNNIDPNITVIDLCETPLFACRWYANKKHAKVRTEQISIFDVSEQNKYDLVCADAFLTRFKGDMLVKVLQKWYNLLKSGGHVVTTVRVHDDKHICPKTPAPEAVETFKQKAISRMKVWERFINLSIDEMGAAAEFYAKNMISNDLGSKEHILSVIDKCGFKIDHIEDIEVSGELYLSRYLRLVLEKA